MNSPHKGIRKNEFVIGTLRRIGFCVGIAMPLIAQFGADQKPTRERILELSITRHGFSAPSVTLEEGSVVLIINNRTRKNQLGLRFDKSEAGRGPGGGALLTPVVESSKDKTSGQAWQQKVQMAPGTYILKDASSGSSLTIQVTAKRP